MWLHHLQLHPLKLSINYILKSVLRKNAPAGGKLYAIHKYSSMPNDS